MTTRVKVFARHSRRLQQGFGAVMIAFAGRHLLRLRRADRRVAFKILSWRPDRPLREKLMNKQSNIATARRHRQLAQLRPAEHRRPAR
jgi:hypothetical protein